MRKLGEGKKYNNPKKIPISLQIPISMHNEILTLLNEGRYGTRTDLIRTAIRELVQKEYLMTEIREKKIDKIEVYEQTNQVKIPDGNGGYTLYTTRRLE